MLAENSERYRDGLASEVAVIPDVMNKYFAITYTPNTVKMVNPFNKRTNSFVIMPIYLPRISGDILFCSSCLSIILFVGPY